MEKSVTGLSIRFVVRIILTLSRSITGDTFVSEVNKSIAKVNDLFPGRLVSLLVSFTLDAIILVEVRLLDLFNSISSNPKSENATSFPLTLLPEIDLILDPIPVPFGVNICTFGVIVSNIKFWLAVIPLAPAVFVVLK